VSFIRQDPTIILVFSRPLFRGRRHRAIFERAEESEEAAEALYRERMWPVSKRVNASGRGDDDPSLIEAVEDDAVADG